MRTLADKVVIITGAGGSIAGAVQEAFARAGARPALVDRDLVRIQGRAKSYGVEPIRSDLATLEEAQRMVAEVKRLTGRVDGLVHLVGDVVNGGLAEVTPEDYGRAFDTNVRTLFYAAKAVLPELRQRDESFIGGIAAFEAWGGGAPGAGLFAASKSAVAALLRSLDGELEGTSTSVGIVFPMGVVATASNRPRLQEAGAAGIDPRAIAAAFVTAALADEGGRLVEMPVYPPRAPR